MSEWTAKKKWNPFNSNKLLGQLDRWKEIGEGKDAPAPVLVTVDPINICDLKCDWCNADFILQKNNKKISNQTLEEIANFLPKWDTHPFYNKVKAVCVAGGGEPLLHDYVGQFIFKLRENNVDVGIVTNGTNIDKNLEALAECMWVGVSVDAGTSNLYKHLKHKDCFSKVMRNIEKLVAYSQSKKTKLIGEGQGSGVSYKFLLHPKNISDIYDAAKKAKETGCRNLHIRPAGIPWDKLKLNTKKIIFTYSHIQEFKEQLEKARQLEDDSFGVFGITHKFDGDLRKSNDFQECHAIFMTAVFMPPSSSNKRFDLGLCCDRRGDSTLTIRMNHPSEIIDFWGSQEHWNIRKKINTKMCPRCTYQPHNQIYENAIQVNNLTYNFI